MKRAILALLVLLAACGNNNTIVGSGQFSAPTALAVVPAADRDLVFVAGTGRDGLRALELCERIDSDGNIQSSCPEDLQFVPGPIRVFPANIETFDRPVQLAGVWLTSDAGVAAAADGGTSAATDGGTRQGVVLVVGADKTVRFVDANKVLDAVNTGRLGAPLSLPLEGVASDVVADNLILTGDISDPVDDSDTLTVSPSVEAFAATVANGNAPAILTEFTVTLDANGAATLPAANSIKKCVLTGVVPSRLALAPRETPPSNQPTLCGTDRGLGVDAGHCFPAPQPTDDIFVGDAKGDGVVRVKRTSLQIVATGGTPPPCDLTRLSTRRRLADGTLDPADRGHSVRALALSPQWYETVPISTSTDANAGPFEQVTINHPAGELLMMVLQPDPTPTPGLQQDPGGLLLADLCTYEPAHGPGDHPHCADFDGGTIVPVPPFRYDQFSAGAIPTVTTDVTLDGGALPDGGTLDGGIVTIDGGALDDGGTLDAGPLTVTNPAPPPQAMEPIAPNGIAREVAFLRAFRPFTGFGQADPNCPDGACTTIFVGQGSSSVYNLFLLAAVTSTDGATYFIDVVHRRFVNGNFYNLPNSLGSSLQPLLVVAPALSPASASAKPPIFLPALGDATIDILPFDFRPGVTHSANWFVIWHDTFPGLERVQGFANLTNQGTWFFDVPSGFADAQADPILQFGEGDKVTFLSYTPPANPSAACKTVLVNESALPRSFEATVVHLNPDGLHPDRLELAIDPALGFNPGDACSAFGAVAEFHTGGAKPWMVHQNETIVARIAQGETFVAHERRYDYPFDYAPTDVFPLPHTVPLASTNEGLSFSIENDEPDFPGSAFTFSVLAHEEPVLYSDPAVINGFANGIVAYSSFASPNAVFTAVTGNDSIIMAQPPLLGGSTIGVRIFR